MKCSRPVPAAEAHEIVDGARCVTVRVAINWGDDDDRAEWAGDYSFCSFDCLAAWVAEKASQHDGRVVPIVPTLEVA